MVDYKITEDLKADRTDWGAFKVVDRFEEFEQELYFEIHNREQQILGEKTGSETAKEKLRLLITRTAREFSVIDEVKNINIIEVTNESASYRVEVIYYTNREFSEVF